MLKLDNNYIKISETSKPPKRIKKIEKWRRTRVIPNEYTRVLTIGGTSSIWGLSQFY